MSERPRALRRRGFPCGRQTRPRGGCRRWSPVDPRLSLVITAALVERVEERRLVTLAAIDPIERARWGQHLTPVKASQLLAGMVTLPAEGTLRVLDPGAGSGSLTAALVARVIDEAPSLALELVVCEIDETLLAPLRATLEECQSAAKAAGVSMTWTAIQRDYLEASLGLEPDPGLGAFNLVIMNPPYGKLAAADPSRRLLASRIVDTPNQYAGLHGARCESVEPRWTVGCHHAQVVRERPVLRAVRLHLLAEISLTRIHNFASRSTVFADTKVLQETIVIAGTKDTPVSQVLLTTSVGHAIAPLSRVVNPGEVVSPDDPQRFIRIPTDDARVGKVIALPDDLSGVGVQGRPVELWTSRSERI